MNLSIIIPAYNVENLIEKCLNSIFNQNVNVLEYEVIVINDGSTDNTLESIKKFQHFPNLKIINQTNKGTGTARNVGLEVAIGNYIWFIDADDFIAENSFSELQNLLLNSDYIAFNFNKINKNGKIEAVDNVKNNKTIDEYFLSTQSLFLWKHIYKNSLIKENKLKFIDNIKNIEDFEFNLQYYQYANTIVFINHFLYNYYENETSTSRNKSSENLLLLAKDSQTVHESIYNELNGIQITSKKEVISELLSRSIIGFFYSLYIYEYKMKEISQFYKTYKNKKLLPIKISNSSLYFKFFQIIVNYKSLYYCIVFSKKNLGKFDFLKSPSR